MSYPEQDPPEPRVLPGYFSPAVPPPPAEQAPSAPAASMPYHSVRQPRPYTSSSALSQPLYPASFLEAVGRFYGKYATFSGRASRSEFWWVQLFMAGLFIAAAVVSSVVGTDLMAGLFLMFMVGSFIPALALTVRRLHDANLSGALALLFLVPYVGFLVVAVLATPASKPAGARFDKVPAQLQGQSR